MKNNKIVAHSQKQLKKTIIFKPFESYIQMNFVVICNKHKILKKYKYQSYETNTKY